MGTLYIDRRGSELEFERGALVVREPESGPRTVPLNLIDRLVVIGNARISGSLLTRLAENGTAVAFLPGRGQRRSAFLLGMGHGDALRRIGQYRLATDASARVLWSGRIVRLRLRGQLRLLRRARRIRPDRRAALIAAERTILQARRALRMTDQSRERIRGHEGSATAAFFRGYVTLFPDSAGFSGRNRRPPRDPVNAALSLGYTLLHGDALRSLSANGLDTTVGLYHDPSWSRESLACDLVELARARVEAFAWRLFAERIVTADSFSRSGEGVRLAKRARQRFFASWEEQAWTHRRWFERAARVLARDCAALGAIQSAGIMGDDESV